MTHEDTIREALGSFPRDHDPTQFAGKALAALAALVRERDEAVTQRKAAEEWARVMEHERDFEQQVVVVNLRSRLEDAERERDTLRAALERVKENAESWHGPEGLGSGHAKALAVIAEWCDAALASVRDEQAEDEAGSSAAASAVGERQGRQPASSSVEQAGSAPATPDADKHACMRCGSTEWKDVDYSGCSDCREPDEDKHGSAGGAGRDTETDA